HPPGLDQLLLGAVAEHGVRSDTEGNALVSASQVGAAVVRVSTGRRSQVLDVVASSTIRVDALDVDHVASAGRDVLDRQGQLTSPAPLVVGMTGEFSRAVVSDVVVMRGDRCLERTPGLVNQHRADDIRSSGARDVVGAESTKTSGT